MRIYGGCLSWGRVMVRLSFVMNCIEKKIRGTLRVLVIKGFVGFERKGC